MNSSINNYTIILNNENKQEEKKIIYIIIQRLSNLINTRSLGKINIKGKDGYLYKHPHDYPTNSLRFLYDTNIKIVRLTIFDNSFMKIIPKKFLVNLLSNKLTIIFLLYFIF